MRNRELELKYSQEKKRMKAIEYRWDYKNKSLHLEKRL